MMWTVEEPNESLNLRESDSPFGRWCWILAKEKKATGKT